MCGLAGVIARRLPDDAARRMVGCLHHRGPDDEGTWADEAAGVALGFRRLAILDLSEAGHQPMVSACGRYVIAFNGEIYNHLELRSMLPDDRSWRGHSDTETLLACFCTWGMRHTLERSVGMFALALWDRRERQLSIARDRFGEKPLYYGWTSDAFVFGSELRALTAYPGFDNAVDRDVLALYTRYSCVPAPYAIYRDVYKLEPGCVMHVSTDAVGHRPPAALRAPARARGITLERYWSFPDVVRRGTADPLRDDEEAIERLEHTLSDAVRLQSVADVPLGAFLSGGIDSSLIVALMQAQSTRRVKTLTIGFSDRQFDEAPYARAIAQHLGTDHRELYVSVDQAREVIPRLPAIYSEPFADSSQIPTHLVSMIARQHVTVALSGDGGDELFGGYRRYVLTRRIWDAAQRMPAPVRRGVVAAMHRLPMSGLEKLTAALPVLPRLGDRAQNIGAALEHAASVDEFYASLMTDWNVDGGIVLNARSLPLPADAAMHEVRVADAPHRLMMRDTMSYLPDVILHKVDRAAMAVSLETRIPFLDHRVAELAWRMPLRMKIDGGSGKQVTRALLSRYVPLRLVDRPKMGFGVPIASWLRSPLRAWAEDLLEPSRLRNEGFFDVARVRAAWEQHVSGGRDLHQQLWTVLMFQQWQEHAAEGRRA